MEDVRLKIYGGTFAYSLAAKRYGVYQETIVKALARFNDSWLEGFVRKRCEDRFDTTWRDALESLETDLKTAVYAFEERADMHDEPISMVMAMCEKIIAHIGSQGLEAEQAIRETVAEGISQEEFVQVRLRALMAVVGQITVGAETLEPLIRDGLAQDGFIKAPSKKAKGTDGKALFKALRDGAVPAADKPKTKLAALNAMPENRELIEWCWRDDEDKGPIGELAKAVGVSLDGVRKRAFESAVGEKDYSSEANTLAFRERVEAASRQYGYNATKLLKEIDDVLTDIDREARTAGDRLFDTREEAEKQRKIVAFEKKLSVATEEEALASREKLRDCIKRAKVDGDWTMQRIEQAIVRFDLEARSVDGREFPTREEAAKQRELSAFEAGVDLSTEASAGKAREALRELIDRLGVDGAWKMTRVEDALRRFDEAARTAFGVLCKTRAQAAKSRTSPDCFFAALRKAVADCGEEKFYLDDKIPPKKLLGARTYLKAAQDDRVFALLDTTFFGSAKTGLVASHWGIVWKNDGGPASPRTAYAWQELGNLPCRPSVRDDATVVVFSDEAAYENAGSGAPAATVADVLGKFRDYAAEADPCIFRPSAEPPTTSGDGRTEAKVTCKRAPQRADDRWTAFKEALAALSADGVFVDAAIPEKKKKNAFASMQVREPLDAICVLLDATVWGSAKDGLVVTDKAVYFKNLMSDPVRLAFEDIGEVAAQGRDIVFDAQHFSPSVFDEDVIAKMSEAFSVFCGKGGK